MSSNFLLLAGLLLCGTALMVLVCLVLRPANAAIPEERRRPAAADHSTALSKWTGSTVSFLERLSGPNRRALVRPTSLAEAGLKLTPGEFLLLMASAAAVAALLGFLIGSLFLAVLLALAVPAGALLLLISRAARRRTHFDEQLGETLQAVTGGLRAGHSLLQSLDAAARESEEPMAEELSRVVNETRLGRDLAESLAELAARMRSDDFGWVAQAVDIHQSVGGDLAQVLDQVGATIRERAQIKRQVNALSAEGRMSALVLTALPVVLVLLLNVINPGYISALTSTPAGVLLLILAGLLVASGGLWLRRLVKIRF